MSRPIVVAIALFLAIQGCSSPQKSQVRVVDQAHSTPHSHSLPAETTSPEEPPGTPPPVEIRRFETFDQAPFQLKDTGGFSKCNLSRIRVTLHRLPDHEGKKRCRIAAEFQVDGLTLKSPGNGVSWSIILKDEKKAPLHQISMGGFDAPCRPDMRRGEQEFFFDYFDRVGHVTLRCEGAPFHKCAPGEDTHS
jgi:hypothetical protein